MSPRWTPEAPSGSWMANAVHQQTALEGHAAKSPALAGRWSRLYGWHTADATRLFDGRIRCFSPTKTVHPPLRWCDTGGTGRVTNMVLQATRARVGHRMRLPSIVCQLDALFSAYSTHKELCRVVTLVGIRPRLLHILKHIASRSMGPSWLRSPRQPRLPHSLRQPRCLRSLWLPRRRYSPRLPSWQCSRRQTVPCDVS
jgi:hypothetical protein